MTQPDVILIGAGIMSATLAVFLKELNPTIKIEIYERLSKPALESSDAWNNAGTGHSAFCELNYTSETKDGTVDIQKALKIAESFEITKQFWSYLLQKGRISNPENFIHATPHMSFVWGAENVAYLERRHAAMIKSPLFSEMEFSSDALQLEKWIPLIMSGREASQKVAATYMPRGTDVNFGNLTRSLFAYIEKQDGISVFYNHQVEKLKQKEDKSWRLKIDNLETRQRIKSNAKFVFIGAGGAALLLLERAKIKEGQGYGGFPVSGQWLKCLNPEIIKQHYTKVYGKASVGSPPMSVPHLDTRMINGKSELLFGPFAGFSTKFLKNGSYLDLIKSLKFDNIRPMLYAGWHNKDLTKYLIKQVLQSEDDRLDALKEYFPNAKKEDWQLLEAGQRVQIIKKDEKEGGILEFGTEIISSEDDTLACLLGASPGSSTAVSIMLDVLKNCFPKEMESSNWQNKIMEMIPTYGKSLHEDAALCEETRQRTTQVLNL